MSQLETIRLLITNDDSAEVERLLSMLRNAGLSLRPQHAISVEGLEKLLNDQAWDLLLAAGNAKSCDTKTVLRLIKKLDKDIPVLLLSEADPDQLGRVRIDGMKAGARDVVALDDDQHLLMLMARELGNLRERRERRSADRKLHESERRCQQLLDSSRDAIAFVVDGVLLYANQSFADRFGYTSGSEISAMPLIDLIAPKDQNTYKTFMKVFKLSETGGTTELVLHGVHSNGSEFGVSMDVSHAIYENEACVQLRAAATGAATETTAAGAGTNLAQKMQKANTFDIRTGVYSRSYMASALNAAISDASERDLYHSLHIISINAYEDLRVQLGVSGRDAVVSDLAGHLKDLVGKEGVLGRMADDEFVLLVNGTDEEQQIQRANHLCKQVTEHIYRSEKKTVHITISIGICPITEKVVTADQVLERAHSACVEARESKNTNQPARYYVPTMGATNEDKTALLLEVIEHTLNSNNFKIQYQPMVSLRGETTEHYEALLVMPADEKGTTVSTDDVFSALRHNHELGKKVDRWMLLNTSKALAKHRGEGHDTRMAVHLTAASLQDNSLTAWLSVALKMANLPADALILQASETDVVDHLDHAIAFCEAARKLGCHTCIKHFGCALDPFKALGYLDVDIIKIDGSFTQDIQDKNEKPDTLKALIGKINQMGKQTIVPLVENASVLATLWQTGVHFIQGHYVQAPSDKMDFVFTED